jgi:hypothetical protein
MQDYFIDKTNNKRFFKYQCKDIGLWMKCLRQVPNTTKKETPEPLTTPKPEPTKPAPEIGGFPCPICSFLAKSQFILNKHIDCNHSNAIPTPEPTAEPEKKL